MRRSNLLPGSLLTREERYRLRLTAQDLQRQTARATSPGEREHLERLSENVEMERRNDRACRPRRKKGRKP